MKIAGLDIGTTGCKCSVFSEDGVCLGRAYRDYPVSRSGSRQELDAGALLEKVYEVLAESAAAYPDIAGIGVTSFGETFVMTDGDGVPLRPAMLYTDPRGREQCAFLTEKFGGRELMRRTGLRAHEMYGLPKMMWIREHEPEVFRRCAYLFQMEDFVVYHLTGRRQIDYSLATRTLGFDIETCQWCTEIFEAAGIDPDRLSRPVPTGTDAGEITPAAAARTGLNPSTHVISISQDQLAAAVGAGVFDSSCAVDGAGTVECLTPLFDRMPDLDTMYRGSFAVIPYVVPGKYATYAFSYTGGSLLAWCTDTAAKKEKELAAEAGCSVNEYLERSSRSPTGLLVLPHFSGAATPYMDLGSRGAILGLTLEATTADLYRGCMEGIAYEMLLNLNALEGSGCCFRALKATGGGARSRTWMQMKADVLNLPITALKVEDAGTVGSAMLTGIAIGAFSGLPEAAELMIQEGDTYYPDPAMHERYLCEYERYEQVYRAVRPLMDEPEESPAR